MIDRYLRQVAVAGAGTGPEWLTTLRSGALERFRAAGLPSAQDEEWRFTPLGPFVRQDFASQVSVPSVGLPELEPYLFGAAEWPRLVLVDGRFRPELSSVSAPTGMKLASLKDALAGDPEAQAAYGRQAAPEVTPFATLNTAVADDGVLVSVAAGASSEVPVHVLHVASGSAEGVVAHPRLLVLVGRGARVSLIESYVALSPKARYWTNAVCEVTVAEGAWVEHCRIQRESEAGYHLAATHVVQARDSHYRSFSFAMGGAIARHDLAARLAATNTETLLYGLYFGHGDQLVDNHTTIYHDHPNCRSWEVYKGVLADRARGVFNGKIRVLPEAQQTDAKQTNRALLLSDAAKVDTKPQLEIFADDVKCTHGATVGDLDPAALFYCRSRGIPTAEARQLLTYAFAAEVLAEVASAPVRSVLDGLVRERLAAG